MNNTKVPPTRLLKNTVTLSPMWDVSGREETTTICNQLATVITDRHTYRLFLSERGEDAQALLNLLQALLDFPRLNPALRSPFINALLRLSRASGLYPESVLLKGVQKHGDDPVASGKYGDVWQGLVGGERVAIKVLRKYVASDMRKFLKDVSREAVLWRQLFHPNVLSFYGIHYWNGDPSRVCLVSPWMDNGDALTFLKKFPGTNRPNLVLDIAQGLDYLHSKKIIHGDIKAVNILIAPSGRACLADFGLAASVDSQVLKLSAFSSGPIGGTLRWEAPELLDDTQERSSSGRMATDIYAFACACYEIFTGNVPFFEISNDAAIVLAVIRGIRPSYPPLHIRRNRGLDDDMWSLMQSCWKAQPKERPTASNVASCLLCNPMFGSHLGQIYDREKSLISGLCSRARVHPCYGSLID